MLKELKFQKCVFEAFGRDLDFLLISLLARFRQFPSYAVLHLNCKRRPGPEVMLCKCCLLPFLDMVSNDLPKITYAVFCQAQSWPFHCIPLFLLWSRKPSTLTKTQELLLQYHIMLDTVIVGNRNVFGIKLFLLGNENSGFQSCFLMPRSFIT